MSEKDYDALQKPKASKPVELGGHIGSIYLLENGAPPYELRIDREGKWFHEGIEIVREDIRNFFSRHLVRRADGGYWIMINGDEAPVVVEDAPFVVVRVTKDERGGGPHGGLVLLLNDGSTEPLDARTIVFRGPNIPYCKVRANLDARFSRPAYYQLAEFIEYDPTNDRYLLQMGDAIIELEVS